MFSSPSLLFPAAKKSCKAPRSVTAAGFSPSLTIEHAKMIKYFQICPENIYPENRIPGSQVLYEKRRHL
jgi:hypothetical protein